MAVTSESTRWQNMKDQLVVTGPTWKHWRAAAFDILMEGRGNSAALLRYLKIARLSLLMSRDHLNGEGIMYKWHVSRQAFWKVKPIHSKQKQQRLSVWTLWKHWSSVVLMKQYTVTIESHWHASIIHLWVIIDWRRSKAQMAMLNYMRHCLPCLQPWQQGEIRAQTPQQIFWAPVA